MNVISATEAKNKGMTRYFTGAECPRGHVAERMVSTRSCVMCISEKKRDWLIANPEKVNSQKREWRSVNLVKTRKLNLDNQKLHRDSANIRNRRYAAKNREKLALKNAEWARNNPDKIAEKVARRRSAKINAMPVWANRTLIKAVYREASHMRNMGRDVHVDHVVPLQGRNVCGLHIHENLEIINAHTNRSKYNQLIQGV